MNLAKVRLSPGFFPQVDTDASVDALGFLHPPTWAAVWGRCSIVAVESRFAVVDLHPVKQSESEVAHG